MQSNNNTNGAGYIGATLAEVRKAIRDHRVRLERYSASNTNTLMWWSRRALVGDSVIAGAGARKFTNALVRRLAKQWWDAGAGTKIVIAWVKGRYNYNAGVRAPPTLADIRTAVITRPVLNDAFMNTYGNELQHGAENIHISRFMNDDRKVSLLFTMIQNRLDVRIPVVFPAGILSNGQNALSSKAAAWNARTNARSRQRFSLRRRQYTNSIYAQRRELGEDELSRRLNNANGHIAKKTIERTVRDIKRRRRATRLAGAAALRRRGVHRDITEKILKTLRRIEKH